MASRHFLRSSTALLGRLGFQSCESTCSSLLPTTSIPSAQPLHTLISRHDNPCFSSSLTHSAHHRHLSTECKTSWDQLTASFNFIKASIDPEGVATVTINREDSLNALSTDIMQEIVSACLFLDRQDIGARVIVVTGQGNKAFAAGADIKEMATLSYSDACQKRLLNGWEALRSVRKPIIASVNGYALGGGCELALMCDIIIAAESASFGQPEVTLGVTPGMGATQRLTRAIGKSRAMELMLTGSRLGAAEAAKMGLISRVVPAADLAAETKRLATKIAGYSIPVVGKIKDCVNAAYETALAEGLRIEKREFWSCYALNDQKEGMAAFVQKRTPQFKDS